MKFKGTFFSEGSFGSQKWAWLRMEKCRARLSPWAGTWGLLALPDACSLVGRMV